VAGRPASVARLFVTSRARRRGVAGALLDAATGIDWNFAPVADLARDQRWGRYYETYAEDPLLAGTLAAASVNGIEGADGAKRVAATVKHFGGYSEPSNGHDRVPAGLDALSAGHPPAVVQAGGPGRCGHRHGQLRCGQRHSGDLVEIPAHQGAA
jgi:beta-glucosidase-like glycosyl hydrolase